MGILIVSGLEGARNCAAQVGVQLDTQVDVAEGRRGEGGRGLAPRRLPGGLTQGRPRGASASHEGPGDLGVGGI